MTPPVCISTEKVSGNDYIRGLIKGIEKEHELIKELLSDDLSPIKIGVLKQANERLAVLVKALANYELKIQEREGWDG